MVSVELNAPGGVIESTAVGVVGDIHRTSKAGVSFLGSDGCSC